MKENKHISVSYELYAIDELGRHLIEKAPLESPFTFISGFGTALEEFENQLVGLEPGEKFDFTLTSEQAYGDYEEERVLELARDLFTVDGNFDRQHVYIDAIVPLVNEQGDRFMGRVLDIRDDSVVIDLNHPLAGKDLNFVGIIVSSRVASEPEIQQLIKQLTTCECEGCGCHGDDKENCDCSKGCHCSQNTTNSTN